MMKVEQKAYAILSERGKRVEAISFNKKAAIADVLMWGGRFVPCTITFELDEASRPRERKEK